MNMDNFQFNVRAWVLRAFGEPVANDMQERGDRFLEEALELLQANGYDKSRVATLRDYVWGRPVGEPFQEVGGVTITLAAYCGAFGVSMAKAAAEELGRICDPKVLRKIRTKQAAKRDIFASLPGGTESQVEDSRRAESAWRRKRLAEIQRIIEAVDGRAMEADGPVRSTMLEMTQQEMSRIYDLARGVDCASPQDDTEIAELRDQLKAGDEDWQRVCNALGARGQHWDPDQVIGAIDALKTKPQASLLRSALEVVHGNALSIRDGEQVDGVVADRQALAHIHSLERLASRLALAIREQEDG